MIEQRATGTTRRGSRRIRLAAVVSVAALVAAGCAGPDERPEAGTVPAADAAPAGTGPPGDPTAVTPADSPAAQLRSGLTALLVEHVYLCGIGVDAATRASAGGDEITAESARAVIAENTNALGYAIGSVYGADAKDRLVTLWRKHLDAVMNYATGRAGGEQDTVGDALEDLGGYRTDMVEFLSDLNPRVDAAALQADIYNHIQTLLAAVDALVAGDPDAFGKLRRAAQHVPAHLASTLSQAIAEQFPYRFRGVAASSASQLRADLVHLLSEHVYLVSMAIRTLGPAGGASSAGDAARSAVEENTKALGDVIGSAYGRRARNRFLELWRDQIGHFEAYGTARRRDDVPLMDEAASGLRRFRRDFSRFLGSVNPDLATPAVERGIERHVDGMRAAIDAVATGDGEAFGHVRDAAQHLRLNLVVPLATATASRVPEKFPTGP